MPFGGRFLFGGNIESLGCDIHDKGV